MQLITDVMMVILMLMMKTSVLTKLAALLTSENFPVKSKMNFLSLCLT